MIIKLKGKIDFLGNNFLIMMVGGVGYKVESAAPFRLGLEGTETEIYTYTHVAERELRLFGFGSLQELELFEKLLTVSGVGPKSAMLLVSSYSVRQITAAIKFAQPERLVVKGVGSKTLAKIIIELRGKLDNLLPEIPGDQAQTVSTELTEEDVSPDQDLISALNSLGYKEFDYRSILSKIDKEQSISQQLKQALQLLRG